MTPVLIGVLLAGAAGVAIAAAVAADRRRQASLSEYCQARGFQFERERRRPEQALADGFAVFREGRQRRWRWTISGMMGGQPFTAFEYTYVKGGGGHSKRCRFAMLLWEAPEARLPRFSLIPEGWLQRLGQRFGSKDFDFDADPEFSRAYQLQGDDEAAVRALFTPGRRAFLMAPRFDAERLQRHHVAGAGSRLLWWRSGRLPAAEQLDQFLAEGDAVRRQFLG